MQSQYASLIVHHVNYVCILRGILLSWSIVRFECTGETITDGAASTQPPIEQPIQEPIQKVLSAPFRWICLALRHDTTQMSSGRCGSLYWAAPAVFPVAMAPKLLYILVFVLVPCNNVLWRAVGRF
jgi:hypothetical protein